MGDEVPLRQIKDLEKKFNDLRVANGRLVERIYMLENKIDKIQAKKELDYVKLIESLLEQIVKSKDTQFNNYVEMMTQMLKLADKKE